MTDTFSVCPFACGRMIPWPDPSDYQHLARLTFGDTSGDDRGTFANPDLDVGPAMDAIHAEIERRIEEHLVEHDRSYTGRAMYAWLFIADYERRYGIITAEEMDAIPWETT